MSAQENEDAAPVENNDDEEEGEETPPQLVMRLPAATCVVAAPSKTPTETRLPLASSILSTPGMLLTLKDAKKIVPQMFADYEGPGGESIRSLYHTMLSEYKTNADDAYTIQGSVKCALFVAFIDLCCAFTPQPTEEACAIIVDTTEAFIGSVRALMKSDVTREISEYTVSQTQVPVTRQIDLLLRLFPDRYDTRLIREDALPLLTARLDFGSEPSMNMFNILHKYASIRDTTFYSHAQYVRTQILAATREKHMYVANIFLRYFIYTLTAVTKLAPAEWQKTREIFKATSEEEAATYFKCKIDSRLRSNFDDLCAYMQAKQFSIESNIAAEYRRYAEHTGSAPTLPLPTIQAEKNFRPQMLPEDAAQQGSGCVIL